MSFSIKSIVVMANTYSQIYLQFVFAVKGRKSLIHEDFREEVQKYITGIVTNQKNKLLAIYANPDHIHILISYKNLSLSISQTVKEIKVSSTNFINGKGLLARRLWLFFLFKKSKR